MDGGSDGPAKMTALGVDSAVIDWRQRPGAPAAREVMRVLDVAIETRIITLDDRDAEIRTGQIDGDDSRDTG